MVDHCVKGDFRRGAALIKPIGGNLRRRNCWTVTALCSIFWPNVERKHQGAQICLEVGGLSEDWDMVWDNSGVNDLIAALLLEVGAVNVSVDEPFRLTSGKSSPIYFDCRRLISSPVAMTVIAGIFYWLIERDKISVDVVAGGESAGIPFAGRLAAAMGKPMVYVRKPGREHGTGSVVEGQLVDGAQTLLVEDMITDGTSKLDFVRGLRDAGALVEHCFVILEREQGGSETLQREGVALRALATANSVLDYGRRSGTMAETDVAVVLEYLRHPDVWLSRGRRS